MFSQNKPHVKSLSEYWCIKKTHILLYIMRVKRTAETQKGLGELNLKTENRIYYGQKHMKTHQHVLCQNQF